MAETFGQMLDRLRKERGWSRNRLALEVGVNPSYITRICHDDRDPPRQHIVEAMARTMKLSTDLRDRLLVKAGYSPMVLNGTGWHPALHELARVLNDHRIPEQERELLATTVRMITQRWGGRP